MLAAAAVEGHRQDELLAVFDYLNLPLATPLLKTFSQTIGLPPSTQTENLLLRSVATGHIGTTEMQRLTESALSSNVAAGMVM